MTPNLGSDESQSPPSGAYAGYRLVEGKQGGEATATAIVNRALPESEASPIELNGAQLAFAWIGYSSFVQFQANLPTSILEFTHWGQRPVPRWIQQILDHQNRLRIDSSAHPWIDDHSGRAALELVADSLNRTHELSEAEARVFSYLDPNSGRFTHVSVEITVEGLAFELMRRLEAQIRERVRRVSPGARLVVSIVPP